MQSNQSMTVVQMQHGCIVMQTSCSIYQVAGLLCRVELHLGPLLQGKLIAALRGPCDHIPTLLHPTSTQQTAHAENAQNGWIKDFALHGCCVLVELNLGRNRQEQLFQSSLV